MDPIQPIVLPEPHRSDGVMSLEEAIASRESLRSMDSSTHDISDDVLSQIFWAGQGIRHDGYRNAPSAGKKYPLVLYWFTREGVYKYDPTKHTLVPQDVDTAEDDNPMEALHKIALGQQMFKNAAGSVLICGDLTKTSRTFGGRALRYALIEVGHVAQNILLTATVHKLAACPTAAIHEDDLSKMLHFGRQVVPLYLVVIGIPILPS